MGAFYVPVIGPSYNLTIISFDKSSHALYVAAQSSKCAFYTSSEWVDARHVTLASVTTTIPLGLTDLLMHNIW